VLSLIYEKEENVEVRHITSDHYFLNPVSATFQGRDIFAPVVGWLSKLVEVDKFGEIITDYTKFSSPKPKQIAENLIKGVVLKVDKFGNIITNLRPEDLPQLFAENPPAFQIIINQQEITRLNLAYSMGKPSELFAIVGSSGFIEICTNRGSAAKILSVNRGAEVGVRLGGQNSGAGS
jgi:S-adenosylmethionine hydrolase